MKVVFWFLNSELFFLCPTPGFTSPPLAAFGNSVIYSCLSIPHTQSPPFLATLKVLSKSLLRENLYINEMSTDFVLLAPGYIWQCLKTFLLLQLGRGAGITFPTKNYQTQNVNNAKVRKNSDLRELILTWNI